MLESLEVVQSLCLDGGSFCAMPRTAVWYSSGPFVAGAFGSASDQSGCVCLSMKVNLQMTVLFQFGGIYINYPPLPRIPQLPT